MLDFLRYLMMIAMFLTGLVTRDTLSTNDGDKRKAEINLQNELNRLLDTASTNDRLKIKPEFESFKRIFKEFNSGSSPQIQWDKIEQLPAAWQQDYGSLSQPKEEEIRQQLSQLVVVKLNGGLGTSMGCRGPKSTIAVKEDLTFLDLTVQQIEYLNKRYDVNVPLVLMNSFYTTEATRGVISKYGGRRLEIMTFQQSAFPRLDRQTLLPLARDADIDSNPEAWYPPGHGDFYESFKNSGLMKKFIDQGKEYVFISNIDNLGATVDVKILNMILAFSPNRRPEMVIELTAKTPADVKGGTLIQYDGRLRLLEIAQVPEIYTEEFKSINKFKVFNTNNVWINLKAMKRVIEDKSLSMTVITNPKSVGDTPVLQLEVAVADAVKCFSRGIGLNVPRSRFLPVKTTSDLLIVKSNLFVLDEGHLSINPQRTIPGLPLVILDKTYFSKVDDFLSRFEAMPDLEDLEELNVTGDVTFGKNVVMKKFYCLNSFLEKQVDIANQYRIKIERIYFGKSEDYSQGQTESVRANPNDYRKSRFYRKYLISCLVVLLIYYTFL